MGSENQGQWEDAYQEAMLRIFSKIDTWEEGCPFCKWLAIVATRRVVDLTRKPRPQLLDAPESIVDERPHSISFETQEIVDSVLQKLSVQERLAWELSHNGIPTAQIAKRVGKSERTVQLWLASTRSKLNSRLRNH
jgi:RNA polymerase sigma factor (sigma-70 family)